MQLFLNSLEEKELILRSVDLDDKRSFLINTTDKGYELLEESNKKFIEALIDLFDKIGNHDANDIVRISEKISKLDI